MAGNKTDRVTDHMVLLILAEREAVNKETNEILSNRSKCRDVQERQRTRRAEGSCKWD